MACVALHAIHMGWNRNMGDLPVGTILGINNLRNHMLLAGQFGRENNLVTFLFEIGERVPP